MKQDGPSRRALFGGTAATLAGVAASACAKKGASAPMAAPATTAARSKGIPGPYPGRVVELHDPVSVKDGAIDASRADRMLNAAVAQLVGDESRATDHAGVPEQAWRRFFAPGDRVGLKVNCVGHPTDNPERSAVFTSHAVLTATVKALRAVGVTDIVIFDRYLMEFEKAGYPGLAKTLGVPWDTAAVSWDETQVDMDGYSKGDPKAAARNAAYRSNGTQAMSGYDPEVFIELDYVHPAHDASDPRTRRSHMANAVTRKLDKIINFCLVKDHMAAGLTGALKNLSHGLVDNVCRSHAGASLNQTSTFVPAVVSHPIIRSKVVLNVMEGFRGIYHMGPWASRYIFEPRSLLVSTDPVALDRVAMDMLDAERARHDLPPLLKAGQIAARGEDEHHTLRGATHVRHCGLIGLGVYAREENEREGGHEGLIDHQRIVVS